MPDRAVAAGEDVVGGNVRIVRAHIIAGVIARHIRIELQMIPAALLLERDEPLDRRARHDCERDALRNVGRLAVPGGEQRGAHRAGPLALRPEHVAVDDEILLVAEQPGEIRRAVLANEAVVARHLSAGRQRTTLLRHPLDMPPELDLLRQQGIAGAAIFGAFVGKADVVCFRQLGCGFQHRRVIHGKFLSRSEAAVMRGSSRTPR